MKTDELMQQDYERLGRLRKLKWLWLFWTWIFVGWLGGKLNRPYWWRGGRYTDGDPTVCPVCKHVCRVRDCIHSYQSDGADDVEGIDLCPKCQGEL